MREILAHAHMPTYDAYESLKLLKEKDLILVETDTHEGAVGEARSTGHEVRRKRGNPLLLVAASFVFVACIVVGAWQKSDDAALVARDGLLRGDSAARARVEQRVRWMLEVYRAENGVYPGDLGALAEKGITSRSIARRVETYHFQYRLTRDGKAYTLL